MNKKIIYITGVIIVIGVIGLMYFKSLYVLPPVPAGSVTQATTTYSLTDIATHNSETSCWTAIRGNVYDLTSWIGRHPGGSDTIRGLCGIDGTKAFEGEHGGERGPENRLTAFQIGILK